MEIVHLHDCVPFITKDGSEIRELLSHRNSSISKQSLAEARVPAGTTTALHRHPVTEEIYYILEGIGEMRLEGETIPVRPGDAIPIPPGHRHSIHNPGPQSLRFLCCCAPGYEHTDTEIIGP